MPAALPKAPKARPGVQRGPLLKVPSSTSCAESRNRRFPNETGASSRFHRSYPEEEAPEICYPANWRVIGHSKAQRQFQRTAVQQEEAWAVRSFKCLGFTCGVWQEVLDKNFCSRKRLLNVQGAQVVRANHLKGESHLGLRRLVAKHAAQ